MTPRIYVGIEPGAYRRVFRATSTPNASTHPQFLAVLGPFRTARGGNFSANYGNGNPNILTVADAERAAKRLLDSGA